MPYTQFSSLSLIFNTLNLVFPVNIFDFIGHLLARFKSLVYISQFYFIDKVSFCLYALYFVFNGAQIEIFFYCKYIFTLDLDADKLGQLGPSLGMKKSSSLESLQTMVQEVSKQMFTFQVHQNKMFCFLQIQMQEESDPAYSYRGPCGALKVIRGRGCEESFRAAVVDPNHRSEIGKFSLSKYHIIIAQTHIHNKF